MQRKTQQDLAQVAAFLLATFTLVGYGWAPTLLMAAAGLLLHITHNGPKDP